MEVILSWHLVGMDLPVGVGERWGCWAADGLGDCRWMGWAGRLHRFLLAFDG